MIENDQNIELLKSYVDTFDVAITDEQAKLLLRHLDLLAEANQQVNLTRIVDPHDAIVRHVVDSLLFLPTIDSLTSSEARFVDIGTGGGFPGIPLGIMRELQGTLIDSVAKKTKFVNGFVQQLGMGDRIGVEAIRAEDLARRESQSYDLVIARAVAQLGALIEYASPLLKMRGTLVVSKANITDEEIEAGERVARITGMRMVSRETFELPESTGHREIIAFTKTKPSSIKLPRTNGSAVHKPLGL